MIEGDLLRRGINQNEIPVRQVFAYMDKYDDFMQMENPFMGGE
jgi:hypothetical protein